MRIISKDLLQAGETNNSAGRAYYACDSSTRYSPYASLTRFRTILTRSTPSLSPATNTQDSGSIVSPGRPSDENSNGFEIQILNSRVTIHSTIQIRGYYSNSDYEQCTGAAQPLYYLRHEASASVAFTREYFMDAG